MFSLMLIFALIFILIELFESYWQWKNVRTFKELFLNNLYFFNKNIFLYLSLHLSFFYAIFLSFFYNNFNFFLSSIVIMKFIDIAFKIILLDGINKNKYQDFLNRRIEVNIILKYYNVVLYPILFILAF